MARLDINNMEDLYRCRFRNMNGDLLRCVSITDHPFLGSEKLFELEIMESSHRFMVGMTIYTMNETLEKLERIPHCATNEKVAGKREGGFDEL